MIYLDHNATTRRERLCLPGDGNRPRPGEEEDRMPDGQVVMRAGFTAIKPALPSAGVRTHQQTAKRDAGEINEITKTYHPMG